MGRITDRILGAIRPIAEEIEQANAGIQGEYDETVTEMKSLRSQLATVTKQRDEAVKELGLLKGVENAARKYVDDAELNVTLGLRRKKTKEAISHLDNLRAAKDDEKNKP